MGRAGGVVTRLLPVCSAHDDSSHLRGTVIAESDDTVVVEGNHYFPPRGEACVSRAERHPYHLRWKGLASYRSVVVDGARATDAAWRYPDRRTPPRRPRTASPSGGRRRRLKIDRSQQSPTNRGVMRIFGSHKTDMVDPDNALPGATTPITVPDRHLVLGTPMAPPFPEGLEQAVFALGCFWGAERKFWQLDGVYTTAVGYAGGYHPQPDLRRGLQRPDRTRRGGAGRVRPDRITYRRTPRRVLREPRPHPGHAAGQRRRAPSTARPSTPPRASRRRRRPR